MKSSLRPRSELPVFRYMPDPVGCGVISENPRAKCPCCTQRTGWAWESEPYGLGKQPVNLCPWCIADGSAAARFGSEFVSSIDGDVPEAVEDEILHRTPGYFSWQDEQWMTHCGDAAAYLGTIGWEQLRALPDVLAAILADGWDEEVLQHAASDGELGIYHFRCLHCGTDLAYTDAS